MAAKTFQFRLSAEGFQTFAADLKKISESGVEGDRTIQALIRSSPQLASALDAAQGKVNETAQAMKSASTSAGEFGSMFLAGGVMGAGMAAAQTALAKVGEALKALKDGVPQAGDAFKTMNAQLLNSVENATIAGSVYERLVNISKQTGVSVGDTANAFVKFNVAARDLGATSGQVASLVEGLQKFATVSGISGPAAAAATTQLSQALASGRFGGDELRSVMENMPQLAQALARELGVATGELRQMGADGKLTSDIVFPALLRAVSDIGVKFDALPSNMERSWNKVTVETNTFLAQIDRAYDISGKIASKWDWIAATIGKIRIGAGFVAPNEKVVSDYQESGARLDELKSGIDAQEAISAQRGGLPPIPQMLLESRKTEYAELLVARQGYARKLSAAIQAEDDASRVADAEAGGRRIEARNLRLQADYKKDREGYDERVKLKREFDDKMAGLNRQRPVMSDFDFVKNKALIEGQYGDAVAKLDAPPKAPGGGTTREGMSWADVEAQLDKFREKQISSAKAIELALDPYAAALARVTEQREKLIAAENLWASSGGENGISPERAAELRIKATEDYEAALKKLKNAGDDSGRAFDQFFSRASSGFEDAIVKGKKFGDVMKGLEGDVARLILRISILDPASKAISGAFSGAGGFSGIFDKIGGWLSGSKTVTPLPDTGTVVPFADGGIMTSAGRLPLNRYAAGGIADRPQVAMFGEGRGPEAYVPLPDGRRIPVAMQGGGGGGTVVNIHQGGITINGGNGASPMQLAQLVTVAANRANQQLVAEINRGGPMARVVGRR